MCGGVKKWAALPFGGSAAVVLNPDFGDCQLAGVLVILPALLLCR